MSILETVALSMILLMATGESSVTRKWHQIMMMMRVPRTQNRYRQLFRSFISYVQGSDASIYHLAAENVKRLSIVDASETMKRLSMAKDIESSELMQ